MLISVLVTMVKETKVEFILEGKNNVDQCFYDTG